jgi:TM2 domain
MFVKIKKHPYMDKIQLFLLENGKKFHPMDMERIREKLQASDETLLYRLSGLEFRDPMMMLVISFLAGVLGIDRFMIGQTGMGVAKLLTFGGCGIWALIDLFLIMDATKKYNMTKAMPYL